MIEGPSRNFVSIRKLLVDSAFLRVFLAAKKENEICWEKKKFTSFFIPRTKRSTGNWIENREK